MTEERREYEIILVMEVYSGMLFYLFTIIYYYHLRYKECF